MWCGECVVEVAGVAIKVVVVTAVSFVDDDNNVSSVAEDRVFRFGEFFFLAKAKLLQGGEVNTAGYSVAEFFS